MFDFRNIYIKHYILISNQLLITDFEFKFKIDREISEK